MPLSQYDRDRDRDRSGTAGMASSSPGFATPAMPMRSLPVMTALNRAIGPIVDVEPGHASPSETPAGYIRPQAVLPIKLPATTLRPVAFRLFTKKHGLTLTPAVLAELAVFVGSHCGARWRDDGLAEAALDEVATAWRRRGGGVIIEMGELIKSIINTVGSVMVAGRVVGPADPDVGAVVNGRALGLDESQLDRRVRSWITVVDGLEMPRLRFNVSSRLFDRISARPSVFASPTSRIGGFRSRYGLAQFRLSRSAAFSSAAVAGQTGRPSAVSSIASMLGRHNTAHVLFGLLSETAAGQLAVSDPSGTIVLDVSSAKTVPSSKSAWITPGMVVLVEGVYREDSTAGATEQALAATGGIGGTVNGVFVAAAVGHPPAERRAASIGTDGGDGPFGWTDFLGVGSDRASGDRMRRIESAVMGESRAKDGNVDLDVDIDDAKRDSGVVAIAACLDLAVPTTLAAVRTMLSAYSADPPAVIVLMGPFSTFGTGSTEYKAGFDRLATVLADFPSVVSRTSLVFVPGDGDGWAGAAAGGAAVPLPHLAVPDIFTRRIGRVVGDANRTRNGETGTGSVVWTTNPSRISWFGCVGEMVLFRDDLSERFDRLSVRFPGEVEADRVDVQDEISSVTVDTVDAVDALSDARLSRARKVAKTLVDQGDLAPFPVTVRPVHADYSASLGIYPLPTAVVVADESSPAFVVQYVGCWVMNPGGIVVDDGDAATATATAAATATTSAATTTTAGVKKGKEGLFAAAGRTGRTRGTAGPNAVMATARWVEFDIRTGKAAVRVESGV